MSTWAGAGVSLRSRILCIQTLRSQILVPELDCMQAELDGTIKLSTPEYGSIEALDLKLQLSGGRGVAMFQPIGFSRPDSWCRGSAFYPPRNHDQSIQYLDYSSHFERKKMWATEKIRRAVVTYNIEATYSPENNRIYYM